MVKSHGQARQPFGICITSLERIKNSILRKNIFLHPLGCDLSCRMEQSQNRIRPRGRANNPQAATLQPSASLFRLLPDQGFNVTHGHCEHWDHSRGNRDRTNDVPEGVFSSLWKRKLRKLPFSFDGSKPAPPRLRVSARTRSGSARRVVSQLVLRKLEADQQLEIGAEAKPSVLPSVSQSLVGVHRGAAHHGNLKRLHRLDFLDQSVFKPNGNRKLRAVAKRQETRKRQFSIDPANPGKLRPCSRLIERIRPHATSGSSPDDLRTEWRPLRWNLPACNS